MAVVVVVALKSTYVTSTLSCMSLIPLYIFIIDLLMFSGFLLLLKFHHPIKLWTTILLKYC